MIYNFMKYLLAISIIIALAKHVHGWVCAAQCALVWDGTSYNFQNGCNSDAANDCTRCDSNYYDVIPVGGACIQSNTSIFNRTVQFDTDVGLSATTFTYSAGDIGDIDTFFATGSTHTCIQFQNQAIVSGTLTLPAITEGHYAVRVRLLMVYSIPSTAQFTLFINNTLNEEIPLYPATNSEYGDYYIYTSSQVQYTQDTLIVSVFETISLAFPSTFSAVGFCDIWIMVADCVPNCIACTSLTTCTQCTAGFILDLTTNLCVSECSPQTFNQTVGGADVCSVCDDECLLCSVISSNCSKCTDTGPYESFLLGQTCFFADCPNGYIQNYQNHTCDCPQGYYQSVGVCNQCHPFCDACSVSDTNCNDCAIGYFLNNGTTTCSATCPSGEYAYLIYDLSLCYLCDTTVCFECVNQSTICTSCNFGTNDRYLYENACYYTCPDGYEGNNSTWVCDQCQLGFYSYFNKCYSECPTYYEANDNIRACVLSGGYPLNMTFSVKSESQLQFKIKFKKLLDDALVTALSSSVVWQANISLYFRTQTENDLIYDERRRLYTESKIEIDELDITNERLIIVSSEVEPDQLVYTHSFYVRFSENLYNPDGVYYQISAEVSTDESPWVVREYYDLNRVPFYLVGIILALAGVVLLLMRVKHMYRISVQYFHTLQLLGLTFYATYPHIMNLDLYCLLLGLNFSNWYFMYNIPLNFIKAATDTISLTSFAFVQGDMNWLRMTGDMLLCLIAMLFLAILLICFRCSNSYGKFFIVLVCDLVIIKVLHSWFASLVYAIINFDENSFSLDFFILGTHFVSYLVLIPVLLPRFLAMAQNRYLNISLIGSISLVILLVLLSLAPMLICSIIIFAAFLEFGVIKCLTITDEEIPLYHLKKQTQIDTINVEEVGQVKRTKHQVLSDDGRAREEKDQQTFEFAFHFYLLRSMKPLTAIMIAIIVMLENTDITIGVVSAILTLLLILILLDAYLLYAHYQKKEDKSKKLDKINPQTKGINQTKEDLKELDEKENRLAYQANNMVIYDEDDIDNDDDIVSNRFKKTAGKDSKRHRVKKQLFKDVD